MADGAILFRNNSSLSFLHCRAAFLKEAYTLEEILHRVRNLFVVAETVVKFEERRKLGDQDLDVLKRAPDKFPWRDGVYSGKQREDGSPLCGVYILLLYP